MGGSNGGASAGTSEEGSQSDGPAAHCTTSESESEDERLEWALPFRPPPHPAAPPPGMRTLASVGASAAAAAATAAAAERVIATQGVAQGVRATAAAGGGGGGGGEGEGSEPLAAERVPRRALEDAVVAAAVLELWRWGAQRPAKLLGLQGRKGALEVSVL